MFKLTFLFFPLLMAFDANAIKVTNSNPGDLQKQIENDKQIQSVLQFDKSLCITGPLAKEDVHFIATFVRANGFESVDLSKSFFKEIGLGLFENCTALKEIKLPKTVKTIAKNAFKNCTSLCSFQCPKNLTSIGSEAFMNCTSLKLLSINKKLSWIGNFAFSECCIVKVKGKCNAYNIKNNHIYAKNGEKIY